MLRSVIKNSVSHLVLSLLHQQTFVGWIRLPHSGFETQGRYHQKFKTGVLVAPQKGLVSSKNLKKKKTSFAVRCVSKMHICRYLSFLSHSPVLNTHNRLKFRPWRSAPLYTVNCDANSSTPWWTLLLLLRSITHCALMDWSSAQSRASSVLLFPTFWGLSYFFLLLGKIPTFSGFYLN